MNTPSNAVIKWGFIGGILTAAALIAYFMIMKWLNLVQVPGWRLLNFLILLTAIIISIRNVTRRHGLSYLDAFGMGCLLIFIGVGLFAGFIFIYFNLNPALLEQLKDNSPLMGDYLSPFTASVSVITEGMISGLAILFCFMQYSQSRYLP
jgi:hypothetical protein